MIKPGQLVTLTEEGYRNAVTNGFNRHALPHLGGDRILVEPGKPLLVLKVMTEASVGNQQHILTYHIDFLAGEKNMSLTLDVRHEQISSLLVSLKAYEKERKRKHAAAIKIANKLGRVVGSLAGKDWGKNPKAAAEKVAQMFYNKKRNK
jgi:hypothetical protein